MTDNQDNLAKLSLKVSVGIILVSQGCWVTQTYSMIGKLCFSTILFYWYRISYFPLLQVGFLVRVDSIF